ncbi:hypothetical protein H0O02_03440 [Candidatus Micrarchaeota archaeon]|nr:hypothetical protein [Candidatus Micrarchaeota archaeon]
MRLSHDATREEVRKMLSEGRQQKPLKTVLLEIGAGVLITGIVMSTLIYASYSRKEMSTSRIAEMVQERTGRMAIEPKEKKEGFCAVYCSKHKIEGQFHYNRAVYEVDLSDNERYWKLFYDKEGNLLVEGIGNESERWFMRPDWDGETKLVRTLKMGSWYPIDDFSGEHAEKIWKEAKSRF